MISSSVPIFSLPAAFVWRQSKLTAADAVGGPDELLEVARVTMTVECFAVELVAGADRV